MQLEQSSEIIQENNNQLLMLHNLRELIIWYWVQEMASSASRIVDARAEH
jgi:hypothetical protein